jgi:signal transduction histidine kinase
MKLKCISRYKDFYIDYQATLKEAIEKMNLNSNGSVVLLKGRYPIAILTQSDIINALGEKLDLNNRACKYATKNPISISEDSSIELAVKILREHNIRRVILVDSDKSFVGVILQERLFDYMGEDIYKIELQYEVDKQVAKRLEREYIFMQQSKLATMGEMIGHIAHQWRQPLGQLGGIFMNLDASYEFNELNRDYFKEKIREGNELIKYMSQTIDDFRNFFMPNQNREYFDVIKYIQSAINIIQATLIYHNIKLEIISPKEHIEEYGYPSEFSQVILNLLDNAKDILVERRVKEPKIVIEIEINKNNTIINIKDNGGGIDEEYIDKIFDIYFSTKLDKGGSGLGLYISKLIIEKKGMGRLKVSNGKEGAIFSIFL